MKPGRAGTFLTPIFVYDDYVDYLRDYSDYMRRFGVTRKDLVKKAGIGAHAFLSDVIARRKKIGKRHIEGMVNALELRGDAAEYFSLLAHREITRDPREKERCFRQLGELRAKNLRSVLADQQLEYFASWRYPIIREYVLLKGVVYSPKEIVRDLIGLKLGSREVENALHKLEKWKLVRYDPKQGGWRAHEQQDAISYRRIPHAVVNDVKRALIEASVHAMETLTSEQRHVSMAIRACSHEQYREFCKRIDALRQEFLELDDTGDNDRVLALNVQLFPVMLADNTYGEPRDDDE
jgi:uncharacterized protein (TIGR02147 family)